MLQLWHAVFGPRIAVNYGVGFERRTCGSAEQAMPTAVIHCALVLTRTRARYPHAHRCIRTYVHPYTQTFLHTYTVRYVYTCTRMHVTCVRSSVHAVACVESMLSLLQQLPPVRDCLAHHDVYFVVAVVLRNVHSLCTSAARSRPAGEM